MHNHKYTYIQVNIHIHILVYAYTHGQMNGQIGSPVPVNHSVIGVPALRASWAARFTQ